MLDLFHLFSLFLSFSLCFSIFLCLSTDVPTDLSVYLSICLSVYLSPYLSIYLSIHLSIYLSIYLSICLAIYLSIYHESCAWTARDMGGLGATEKQLDAQTPLNECFVFFPLLHQSEHPPLFLGHLASFGSFRPPEPHIFIIFSLFSLV